MDDVEHILLSAMAEAYDKGYVNVKRSDSIPFDNFMAR